MTHSFGFLRLGVHAEHKIDIYAATLDLGNKFLDMYVSPSKGIFFCCSPQEEMLVTIVPLSDFSILVAAMVKEMQI